MATGLILGRRGKPAKRVGFAHSDATSASGDLITYSGDGHLVTLAPTGTGKTSGPVICNALTHPGQLIVIDIKGEIYRATAQRRRAMGQEVHVLDMRNESPLPGALNPLDILTLSGIDHATLARSFAAELIERTGEERERFWNDWSETMIAGGITWLLADNENEKRRLSALFDLFSTDDVRYNLAVMLDTPDCLRNRSSRQAFASFAQISADVTRDGILASAQSHLRLFDSDVIRRLTDTSTMDVAGLILGEPMSLYIIVPPQRLAAYRPILRLWLSNLILAMTQREKIPEHRTLMLCDEVGNLGRIDALLTATTLMRSWGLTLWCFFQNVAQTNIYGNQAHTLIDNAGVVQVFGARNFRMAQDIANLIGGVSAEQVMSLAPDEQLLLIEGKLTRCKQARYYNDELFR